MLHTHSLQLATKILCLSKCYSDIDHLCVVRYSLDSIITYQSQ